MNLLNYTKNLYRKIIFYDKHIKDTNFQSSNPNPFRRGENSNITVIWIQKKDKKL